MNENEEQNASQLAYQLPQQENGDGSLSAGFGLFWVFFVIWIAAWGFVASLFDFFPYWLGGNLIVVVSGTLVWSVVLMRFIKEKRTRWGVQLGLLTWPALAFLFAIICSRLCG